MINPLLLLSADWIEDCMEWRGRLLTGHYAHWCGDWDDLVVDETCEEFECCYCFELTPLEQALAETQPIVDDALRRLRE